MNIGTWIVQSVRSKEIELVQEMRKYKISLPGVTETKKKGQGIEDLRSHKLLYSGVSRNERTKGGVALIVTNEIYENLDYNFVNERLLEANIELPRKNVKIIVAYGPNKDVAKVEKDDFYNQLQVMCRKY